MGEIHSRAAEVATPSADGFVEPTALRQRRGYAVACVATSLVFLAVAAAFLGLLPGYSSTKVTAQRGPFGVTVRVLKTSVLSEDPSQPWFKLDEVLDPTGRVLRAQSVAPGWTDIGVGSRESWSVYFPEVPSHAQHLTVRARVGQGRRVETIEERVPIRSG